MMGDPRGYLNSGQLARIGAAAERGWATRVQVAGGTVEVVLARWNTVAQAYDHLPADVLVEYQNRQPLRREEASGSSAAVYGYLSRPEPFDVRVEDLFSLPSGATGRVTDVEQPRLGIVRAAFELRTGG